VFEIFPIRPHILIGAVQLHTGKGLNVASWTRSNQIMEMQSFACSFSLLLFRPLPDENKEFFLELQKMVEDMAEKTGGPVVIIAHSMGNMYTLYFLNHQPQAWKDRYIKSYISLGAPWAGVAKTLRVIISGKRFYLLLLSAAGNCKQFLLFTTYR